jgi:hypothetical protein
VRFVPDDAAVLPADFIVVNDNIVAFATPYLNDAIYKLVRFAGFRPAPHNELRHNDFE